MLNIENIKSREFIFFWLIWSIEHISLKYRLQWEKWKLFCSNCPKEALMGGGGNINYARTTFCRCLGRRKCWWAVAIFCISAKYSQIFENIISMFYILTNILHIRKIFSFFFSLHSLHPTKYFASVQNILRFLQTFFSPYFTSCKIFCANVFDCWKFFFLGPCFLQTISICETPLKI